MDTYCKVVSIIGEQLGIPATSINRDSDIIKDLGADSIDVVQLLMALEDECGVTVSEDDADRFKTCLLYTSPSPRD